MTKQLGMTLRYRKPWVALPLVLAATLAAGAPSLQGTPPMTPPSLTPQRIAMGALYNGARVRIDGTAPAAAGIVVEIEGTWQDETFDRKGRVGPIWLTVDKIHVQQAPSVFLRFSSAPIESLLDRDEIQRYRLDATAIVHRCRILCQKKCSSTEPAKQRAANGAIPDPRYAAVLASDFLNFKEHAGAYAEHPGTVQTVSTRSGTAYSLNIDWPRSFAPGSYRVRIYACRGLRVIAQSSTTLLVEEVGFPAYMANLAETRPWEYGILAVLAALLAGFLTDLLTTSLRRRRTPRPAPQANATELHHPGRLHNAGTAP